MAYICKLLQLLCGNRALVQTIARNTLPICAFHLIVFAVIKGIMLYLLGLSPDILSGTFLPNALFALLSMAVCLLVAKVVDRFAPFVLGK
jgi:fucose 4-O-acetylase-like acetyltransferase